MAPTSGALASPDLTLDHVGSLGNAAPVITSLHRGEKRLVFCDSRSRVEQLAVALRERNVRTLCRIAPLALDKRRRAEEAFAEARDCVIVATSTLELGIDVGDLDCVIQIDTPSTVAAFLQRSGRAGRGVRARCGHAVSHDEARVDGVGGGRSVEFARQGVRRRGSPPAETVAPARASGLGIDPSAGRCRGETSGPTSWPTCLSSTFAVELGISDQIVNHLLQGGVIFDEAGVLSIGPGGESRYGYRHFTNLASAFTSDPLFVARHGATEIGYLHPISLLAPDRSYATVLLAGRAWDVVGIDWNRQTVALLPSDSAGSSKWMGGGVAPPVSCADQRARYLAGADPPRVTLSKRASSTLDELREVDPGPWDRTHSRSATPTRPVTDKKNNPEPDPICATVRTCRCPPRLPRTKPTLPGGCRPASIGLLSTTASRRKCCPNIGPYSVAVSVVVLDAGDALEQV